MVLDNLKGHPPSRRAAGTGASRHRAPSASGLSHKQRSWPRSPLPLLFPAKQGQVEPGDEVLAHEVTWRILQLVRPHLQNTDSPEATDIIVACLVLHNLCIRRDDYWTARSVGAIGEEEYFDEDAAHDPAICYEVILVIVNPDEQQSINIHCS